MSIAEVRNGHDRMLYWLCIITTCLGLYLTTFVNYLLFHSLVELFSIIVAATVFIITWNSVKYIKNPFLIIVGISYLFIAILDLLHTLAYKGMPIFTDYDYYANQLWIAARFLESSTMLVAFYLLFEKKNVNPELIFAIYTLITTLLVASIFYWKIFPVCFIDGKGLTSFKVYSEYVICAILVASIVLLVRNKTLFTRHVYDFILLSLVFTIISELAFTFYINNYGISNIVGHYFKLFAFMMIYRAIVSTGINKPYSLIFKELNQKNISLSEEIELRKKVENNLESEINERKQAEIDALRLLLRKRAILDNLPMMAWLKDTESRLEMVNEPYAKACGRPLEECLGKTDLDLFPEEMARGFMADDHEVCSSGRKKMVEEQVNTPDGIRWHYTCKTPIFDEKGTVIGTTGIAQDITERRQTEQALIESERRFRDIANASADWIWEVDCNGVYVFASQSLKETLGYEPEEILGRTIFDLMPANEAERVRREYHARTERHDSFRDFENINLHKNGTVRHILTSGVPIIDGQGTLLGYRGVDRDITERKQAEEQLSDIRADLARAQEVGGIGSWRLNVGRNELTWSDETYRIFGIPKGTPLSYESFLDSIHPDDRMFVDTQWIAALGGEPYDIEHRIVVAGKVKWVREKAFLELAGPDNLLGGFGIVQDITRRKEVEEELLKARDELEMRVKKRTEELAESLEKQRQDLIEREKTEVLLHQETLARLHVVEALREKERMLIQQSRQAAMGEMIGNIAHQWRQPLNALGLFTQRIGFFYGTPNFNKEMLDTSIAKSMEIIQHMSKTIDDFKDYFKPDKEKADFRVGDAVNNTMSLLEGSFQHPRIRITIEAKDNPVINGFQNEFAQVLLNILINARDAILEREIVDAEVTITISSEEGCAIVTIADNAGGIPDAIVDKVFDPYFTTKGPQKGTGVGLFMSKAIIEKNMGGKLTVRNTDTGAEFRIEV